VTHERRIGLARLATAIFIAAAVIAIVQFAHGM
jgi:hypothetical protein